MVGRELINKKTQASIRIHDGLLLVMGAHGAGKTTLLNSIDNHNYALNITEEYNIYSLFLNDQAQRNKHLVSKVFSGAEEEWEEQLDKLLKETFSKYHYDNIKEKIPCLSCILYDSDMYAIPYQRLVILVLLKELAKKEKLMILVDEPEQFAHPLLIREICALLKEIQMMGNVLIMSTNSQIVVQKLFTDIEQVLRLERGTKNSIITQPNADEIVKSVKQFYIDNPMLLRRFSNSKQIDIGIKNIVDNYIRTYLSSVLRAEIFNIIFSKYIILGEGSSEDVLFDYIEQVLHPDWTRDKMVNYIGCMGKSSMPFHFIFLNSMGIGTICMYDYDNDTNEVHRGYAEAFRKYEVNNKLYHKFVLQPDLEQVLRIEPEYKLMPIEKPVNVFHETFVTQNVREKVEEIMHIFESMINEMEGMQ